MNLKDSFLEEYSCNANDNISFTLVRDIEDIQNNVQFYPEFTHQFFGENEKIFGYKNLKIKFYFSAYTLIPCVNITYDEKIEDSKNISVDKFEENLLSNIPEVQRNFDLLRYSINCDSFKCFGKMIDQYERNDEIFEIYHVTGSILESDDFKQYNNNLQYLLLFFVDGSSFIDLADKAWEYFIVYQKYKDSNQNYKYATIGFMTVYNFFAYPDKIRQRISQVLIFPPYQKQGHGERLLTNFYNLVLGNKLVKDITVEDPSDQFQILRDYLDCKNVLNLKEFNTEIVKGGMYKKFSDLVRTHLKISNQQICTVYEILGLKFINKANNINELKYKKSVIERLNDVFGRPKDICIGNQFLAGMDDEKRAIYIEKECRRLLDYYAVVIEKLERSL